jgi:hypothetical protein
MRLTVTPSCWAACSSTPVVLGNGKRLFADGTTPAAT